MHKFTIFLMGLILTIVLVGCSNSSTETATRAEVASTIAQEETQAEVVAETNDEKSAKIQYNLEEAIFKIGQGMDKQLEETEFSDPVEAIYQLNSGMKYYEVAKGYLLEAYADCGDISKYSKLKDDIYECYLNISTLTTEMDVWEVMHNDEILNSYKTGFQLLLLQRTVLYADLYELFDTDLEY